jgi:hypothetical protein
MKISLRRFLQTGLLGELHPGLTKEQVVELLGVPEVTGGTSRRYRHPQIYKYGCLEIYFRRQLPYDVVGLFVDGELEHTAFTFGPSVEVEDWELQPKARRADVEAYLAASEIRIGELRRNPTEIVLVALESTVPVRLTFDENEELISISAVG